MIAISEVQRVWAVESAGKRISRVVPNLYVSEFIYSFSLFKFRKSKDSTFATSVLLLLLFLKALDGRESLEI